MVVVPFPEGGVCSQQSSVQLRTLYNANNRAAEVGALKQWLITLQFLAMPSLNKKSFYLFLEKLSRVVFLIRNVQRALQGDPCQDTYMVGHLKENHLQDGVPHAGLRRDRRHQELTWLFGTPFWLLAGLAYPHLLGSIRRVQLPMCSFYPAACEVDNLSP